MKEKRPKKRNSHASFSRHEIAQKLSCDVRTVTRRCASLGIKPKKRSNPKDPLTYRLTPGDFKRLETPLARGYGSGSQLPDGLKREKLQEEVENLRLRNKRAREASTPNWFFAELLKDAAEAVPGIIEAHFETYALDGASKEPAELRSLGKSTNDAIRAEVFEFLGKWSVKWEALSQDV
jgi:hypothetical protein